MTDEFYIGQIFEGMYPPEAAEWCNNRQDCYIEEVEAVEEKRHFVIKEARKPTPHEREEVFKKEFFLTSLGYIRRKVNMATGETKDFLSDLLPTISMGVQTGQNVPIITYKEPDFTQELTLEYMESLQVVKNVTPAFIQECFMQVSTDFLATPLIVKE